MVEIAINGRSYRGWKRVRVTRSIEAMSGSFEFMVSDRWGALSQPLPILEGDECAVSIEGTTVLTGRVDRRRISLDAGTREITIAGRDRTGVLVDCSALLSNWEFTGARVQNLAFKICAPFGIPVSYNATDSELAPLPKLVISPGDSGFEVIEKACRMRGLLAYADGAGGLVLASPGAGGVQVSLGEHNVLAIQSEVDASARFRRYVVLAQAPGTEEEAGATARGEAQDLGVLDASRVLVVHADGAATNAYAKRRAQWEATVRAARAEQVSIVVQGWTQGPGLPLWPVNAIVQVAYPSVGVNGPLLIAEAVYSQDEGGTTTELTLRRPDAYAAQATVNKNPTRWGELSGLR